MNELEKRLEVLEKQKQSYVRAILTKPDLCSDDDSSSFDESIEGVAGSPFHVELHKC